MNFQVALRVIILFPERFKLQIGLSKPYLKLVEFSESGGKRGL